MAETVVVLGAGYAGARAITSLESSLSSDVDLVWISRTDYHLVLHESHRAIRDPSVEEHITIPIEDIAADSTTFIQGEVVGLDVTDRAIELADGESVEYDYVLVALGSGTAFYGIPGLAEHAHTLKSLKEAHGIHDAVVEATESATEDDPAQIVVGGAGLSGIQTAGEVAGYRDDHDVPLEVHLVEALDEIFPGQDSAIQSALRSRLEDAGVQIHTSDPITEAESDVIHFDEGDSLPYDVLVWTGGITGQDALTGVEVREEHNRLVTDATFETSDERVFAIGDTALIDQGETVAPPTAQAAWQAADLVGTNIQHAMEDRELAEWTFKDKGTVISIGERAVAHDVMLMPISTFGGFPARTLKKIIAARWIASITSWGRALRAWSVL
ncbi:MAG: NAD(P)/FAD-dependent oxidoreductase [Natrialbaceae archaeon]|nr:NAD(P)/FAD-dependent oxidoreductase [Natrialbaceae archaeon]